MKIFVGNFAFSMTDSALRSLFEPFGAIESASVVTDQSTGHSRGFGFVEMGEEDAAKAIASLNGSDSGGRTLTVNQARPKVDRGSSRGSWSDSKPRNGRQPRW